MRRARQKLVPAILMLCFIMLANCSLPRLVPVQTARVTQTEAYSQWYTFESVQEAADVFRKLLGTNTWQTIENHLAGQEGIDSELIRNEIVVKGTFTVQLSLVPFAPDSFFVDGSGRYALLRTSNREILFTGDFFLVNQRFAIADLDQGVLTFRIRQFMIRHFAPTIKNRNYMPETEVTFNIKMRKVTTDLPVYVLDYGARHDILFEGRKIGLMQFDAETASVDKIIDLRGLKLIRNDYAGLRR